MSSSIIRPHTQTLRQAKAAYRKSGPGHRFTEVEIRQMNRNAELLERAERIKKKEQNKKTNKIRKEQKLEKEREARRKVGLPEVKEEYIGPSQPRLSGFVHVGIQQETEDRSCQKAKENGMSPSRSALKTISGNRVAASSQVDSALLVKPKSPNEVEWADLVTSNTQIAQELKSSKLSSPKCTHAAIISNNNNSTMHFGCVPNSFNPISFNKGCSNIPQAHSGHFLIKDQVMGDDSHKLNLEKERHAVSKVKKDDLSPRKPDSVEQSSVMPTFEDEDFQFQDGITDDELQVLAQEILSVAEDKVAFETQPVVSKSNFAISTDFQQESNDNSFYDQYAPSSQDLLNIVLCENDFDKFNLPTQELLDLVP